MDRNFNAKKLYFYLKILDKIFDEFMIRDENDRQRQYATIRSCLCSFDSTKKENYNLNHLLHSSVCVIYDNNLLLVENAT